MKKIIYNSLICALGAVAMLFTSCDGYLNEKPKGKDIPEQLADYEGMLRYEYGAHRMPIDNAGRLMNDIYTAASSLNYYPLYKANYLWDTSIDRVYWNNSDETIYYQGYGAIGTMNLIIENALTATEATDAERQEVLGYAKVLRAMNYFQIVNYYADTYNPATAADKGGIPWITSSAVNAPYAQESVKQIYDHILADVDEALPYIPDMGTTILHPGKGAAYAFLARVYMQMMNYEKALEYANMALAINDKLFDWNAFYEKNKAVIEAEGMYNRYTSPMDFSFEENYNFNHQGSSYSSAGINMPTWRGTQFEEGDSRFLSCWKFRDYSGGVDYYYAMVTGYFNYGGQRTSEVYLIKAECEARAGNLEDAMNTLNKVREKRILPQYYVARTATTKAEAIEYIRQTKFNEMVGSIMTFADARRYNSEGTYPVTLTHTIDGVTSTLAPDSYLWTMPFPQGAIENAGGGSITQNVDK